MLIDEILSLHTARERIEYLKAAEDEAHELLLQTQIGQKWFNLGQAVKAWKRLEKELYSTVRGMTVARFEEDGDKHPEPGVSIREYKGKPKLDVHVDEFALLEWARVNAPMSLAVDREMLLDMVQKGKVPDYIATSHIEGGGPRAAVDKNLADAVSEIEGGD